MVYSGVAATKREHEQDLCEDCCGAHHEESRNVKARQVDTTAELPENITTASSLESAAACLVDSKCIASVFSRSLPESLAAEFLDYCTCRPQWPNTDDYHPLEATWDRVAVIEFRCPTDDSSTDPLSQAIGYGRNLPPRFSPNVASAKIAISEVTKVLPAKLASFCSRDAAELLTALHKQTGHTSFKFMLDFVLGDTCQRWHCDQNISRALVTYAGPGTVFSDERGVTREACGSVTSVEEECAVQASRGDFLLMKGGRWEGARGRGCAHKAPPIGHVTTCSRYRLMIKVDVLEN